MARVVVVEAIGDEDCGARPNATDVVCARGADCTGALTELPIALEAAKDTLGVVGGLTSRFIDNACVSVLGSAARFIILVCVVKNKADVACKHPCSAKHHMHTEVLTFSLG